MAPIVDLFARDDGCGSGFFFNGGQCQRKSGWYFWGRWVLAGIAVVLALILLFSCLCITRRNRRRGVQPMYGTGWFSGVTSGHPSGNNKYNAAHEMNNYQTEYNQGGYNQQQPPYNEGYGGGYTSPPPYGQPPVGNQATGTTFNANDGYTTGQHYGVQQPQSAYHQPSGYAPPAGPPPGK